MSTTQSIPQPYCGCPTRQAPEIRGVIADTITEHVDGCTAMCADSEMWECPNGCGLHIKDGPVADGEARIDDDIRDHLELCDGRHNGLVDAAGLGLVDLDAATAPTVDPHRAAYTAGLREIADWLDAHPEVPLPYLGRGAADSELPALPIWVFGGDQREQLATIARAMASGGRAEKRVKEYADGGDSSMQVWRQFSGIVVYAQADRAAVCERVVTGTREVTREMRDPEALAAVPTVTVTTTVEDVEWVCGPLLADLPGGAA